MIDDAPPSQQAAKQQAPAKGAPQSQSQGQKAIACAELLITGRDLGIKLTSGWVDLLYWTRQASSTASANCRLQLSGYQR